VSVTEKDSRTVVVGLGLTGISCARYLQSKGSEFSVVDSRNEPPGLPQFEKEFPGIRIRLGNINDEALAGANRIVVSPGVSLAEPAIQRALLSGVNVCGDIDLFREEAKAPIVGITGSNGKSTVTTLLGKMLEEAGKRVAVGGNIGVPALDLLGCPQPDFYVLELSSFQLERSGDLRLDVATVLNVSADHMDRYDDLSAYTKAKHRVFHGCKKIVYNRADLLSISEDTAAVDKSSFGLSSPGIGEFGLLKGTDGADGSEDEFLAFHSKKLMPVSALKMVGRHNLENALAAMSLAHTLGVEFGPMIKVLENFPGLDHRCKFVAEVAGVHYNNDSKGTNVGAAVASIQGLSGTTGKIVLIAGGESKGADFSPLLPVIKLCVRAVVVIGEAAKLIEELCSKFVLVESALSMEQAVLHASRLASAGDAVLLSPACASFDMFNDYQHRGEVFCDSVARLLNGDDC
jgi:UDP-N-acetylmuramoylalanine--D-glutamate ligase